MNSLIDRFMDHACDALRITILENFYDELVYIIEEANYDNLENAINVKISALLSTSNLEDNLQNLLYFLKNVILSDIEIGLPVIKSFIAEYKESKVLEIEDFMREIEESNDSFSELLYTSFTISGLSSYTYFSNFYKFFAQKYALTQNNLVVVDINTDLILETIEHTQDNFDLPGDEFLKR